MTKKIKFLIIFSICFLSQIFAQDAPDNFQYNQSRFQAFYLFLEGDIDGNSLNDGDWIAAFNGETCIGSQVWSGEYTSLPIMGDDGSQWTNGYLEIGDIPTFKIYDVSANTYYTASSSEDYPFENLGTWVVNSISVGYDCAGTLGGIAYLDDCGVCSGGDSGHIPNSDQDCQGICFGDAYFDGCGTCVGGTTGEDPCPLDCMGILTPDDCSNPLTPGCAVFDDCGVCVQGTSGNTFNQDADCLGECFGSADYDECGICDGDNSSCNQPVAYYQTVSMNEDDGSITIVLEATDPNEDPLTYSISTPNNGLLISGINSNQVIYTPDLNFNGQDSFTFTVSDGTWTSGVGVVTINVIPVNDSPVIENISEQDVNEDSEFLFNISATDIDGDLLTYQAEIDGNGSVSINENNLSILPDQDFYGEITVTVFVSDGQLDVNETFILNVLPINDPPILSLIPDQIIDEDDVLVYELDVLNVDNDMIFYSASVNENFTAAFSNNTLTIAPTPNWSGSGYLTIYAFDGEYISDQTFLLTVLPVNDYPVLETIQDYTIDEDESLDVVLLGSDIDSEVLSFSSSVDGNAETQVNGNILSVVPNLNFYGDIVVTVVLSDGDLDVSQTFSLTVNPVNDPPELDLIPDAVIDEDGVFTYSFSAIDIDSDELIYGAIDGSNVYLSVDGNELVVVPNPNWFGDAIISVTVYDGEYTDSQDFTLTVNPVNDSPVLESISNQETDEDNDFVYQIIATDIDNENLLYGVSSSANSDVSIDGSFLTVYPDQDYNGDIQVLFSVTDGEFILEDSFLLTVNPVNDTPVLDIIGDQEINEDESFSLNLSASDVDGDQLYFGAEIDGNASFSVQNSLLTIDPDPDWNGVITVTVSVTDTQEADTQTFTLEVNPVNDEPELQFISDQEINEDELALIDITASDIDGDDLDYDFQLISGEGLLNFENEQINFQPDSDWFGTVVVEVSVSDSEFTVQQNFNIYVAPVNDAPIASDLNVALDEDSSITFDFLVSDVDNDLEDLNILLLNAPQFGQLEINGLSGSYIPNQNLNGTEIIDYKVTDGSASSESKLLTIQINPINDNPVISQIANQEIDEDNVLVLTMIATDVDEDVLIFSASNGDTDLDINGDQLTITPALNFYGDINISVSVTDGELFDNTSFILTVNPVNDAPTVVNIISDLEVEEDSDNVSIDLSSIFNDVENGQNLSYSVSESINALTASIDNNLLVLSFNQDEFGQGEVVVTASDAVSRLTVSTSFNVRVIPINDAPILSSFVNEFIDEDTSLTFELSATDVDNSDSQLQFQVENGGAEILIDGTTVILTPELNYFGSDDVTVTVTDGELFDTTTFTLTVNPINDAPTLDGLNDGIVNEDNIFILELDGSDVDGDPLTFLTSVNDNASVSIEDSTLMVNPAQDYNGDIEVTVIASDGQASGSGSFILSVIPVNDAPILSSFVNEFIDEDTSLTFELSATDVDNSDSQLQFQVENGGAEILIDGTTVILTPELNYFGSDDVTVTVTDGELFDTTTFTLTVNPINDAPTFITSSIGTVDENQNFNYDLEINDVDNIASDLNLTIASGPSWLSLSELTLYGTPTYNDVGTSTILLNLSDGEIITLGSFVITVNAVNDPPVAVNQSVVLNEDESATIYVYGNDDDSQGLSFTIIDEPENGMLISQREFATYVYNPNPNFYGTDSFTFRVSDGEFFSEGIVDLTINGVNDAPTASNEYIVLDENTTAPVYYIAEDVDGNDLSIVIVSGPNYGTLENGIYTPNSSYSGVDLLVYQAFDGELYSNQATVEFEILNVNDAPVAFDMNASVYEDSFVILTLLGNDPDGDPITYSLDGDNGGANLGYLSGFENIYTYIPYLNINGTDVVSFFVTDDSGAISESASVTIDINPVNDPPSAGPITFNGSGPYDFSSYISDPDDDLITLLSLPPNYDGNLNGLLGGVLTNTHHYDYTYSNDLNPNAAGDIVLYKASDGISETSIFPVVLNIAGGREWQRFVAPQALSDDISIAEDEVKEIELFGYDAFNTWAFDADTQIVITSDPSYGTLSNLQLADEGVNLAKWTATYTPTSNVNNVTDSITFTVINSNNTQGISNEATVSISISPINDVPVIVPVSDVSFDEDSSLSVPVTYLDYDFDTLTASVSSTNESVSAQLDDTGFFINLLPANNFNGSTTITLFVSDDETSSSTSFNVSVNPVNDAPAMVAISDVSTIEESPSNIYLNAIDIDGDTDFTFSASTSSDLFDISISGSTLTINPLENQVGTGSVSVLVNDGGLSSESISFDVTIENVNDAPVLSNINNPEPVFEDGEDIVVELNVSDADNDEISFTFDYSNDTLFESITVEGNTLIISPLSNANGVSVVNVFASDGFSTVTDNFTVEVIPVNDPPTLADLPDVSFNEEESISIALSGTDVDSPDLLYSVSSNDNVLTSIVGNILYITGNQDYYGSETLTLSVSDGIGTDSQNIMIIVNAVNDAPVLATVSDVSFDEDGTGSTSLSAEDVDGDDLEFSILGGSNITATLSGSDISFSAPQDYSGNETFTVFVTDGTIIDSQSIIVTVNAVNDAPVANATSSATSEDQSVIVILSGSDVDGDNLTFSLDSNASNGSVTLNGSVAMYIPAVNYFGDDSFSFSVSDGIESSSASVSLSVSAVNDAPILASVSDVSFDEDTTGTTSLFAEDVDGDDLEFSISGGIDISATLNGSDVSFSTAQDYSGSETFTISVTDGIVVDSQIITVTVNAVNDAPVLSLIGNQQFLEDGDLTILLSAFDVEGDNLSFSIQGGTDIASSISGTEVVFNPNQDYFGSEEFIVTVTDGILEDSETFSITVESVNDAPILSTVSDVSFDEDSTGSISLFAEDVDGDDLEFSISGGSEIAAILSGSDVSFSASQDYNGSETFTVFVTDGTDTDSQTIIVTVNAVNDAPVAQSVQVETYEDAAIVIQLDGSDVDSNLLTYTVTTNPLNGILNVDGGLVTYTPNLNYFGNDSFSYLVSDGILSSNEAVVTLSVLSINDAPSIITTAPIEATEDIEYVYQVEVEDPDNDIFNYALENAPEGMIISDSGLITWTALEGVLTSGLVTLSVSDGELTVEEYFEISVESVNDVPAIISQAPLSATEDIEYMYQIIVEDPDDESFIFGLNSYPEGMVVTPSGLVSWTPLEGVTSSGLITIVVSDGELVVEESFEVTVTQVNDSPLIITSAPADATEDIEYIYQVGVEDPDNDVFVYTLENEPDGMMISDSGLITWTALEGVLTSGLVTLSVSDGELSVTESFEITVTQINDIPIISSIAPTEGIEDIEFIYQVEVEDPDNDLFSFELENAPEGMTISESGLITWTPLEGIISSGLVTIIVGDNEYDVAQAFVVTVTQVNDSPVISSSAPDFVYLGETYMYEVEVTDPDDTEFTFFLVDQLPGMSISNSGIISWIPESVGEYGPITVMVADGGEDSATISEQQFYILVDYDFTVIDFNFSAGNNLISLYSMPPEDSSVETVFGPLGNAVTDIIGESQLAFNLPNIGWVGSLDTLYKDKGYWVRLDENANLPVYGLPTDNVEYVIHEGANLISYPFQTSQSIEDALPDFVQQNIWAIFGQGISAMNINGQWLGSLNSFEGGYGYWIIAMDNFVFEYNQPSGISLSSSNSIIQPPRELDFYQSVQQSFYFIEDLELIDNDIEIGDWIVAYNDDVIVGSRMWNGQYTDIPVMGYDSSDSNTIGYCKSGDIPSFKLHKSNSSEIIDLVSDQIPEWNNNQAYLLSLSGLEYPYEAKLHHAYPNPFNPSTTIEYEVPEEGMFINLSIYDLRGRIVAELVNEYQFGTFDSYKVVWNAKDFSSGVYFIRLQANQNVQTQKIMLIK